MPVQDWMSKDLITVDEDASIMKASKIMKQNGIKHLPVMRKGRVVGIISDRELKEATPSKATTLDIHEMYHLLDHIKVKSLMPKHLFTITPGETAEKAAAVMLKQNISALPVVDAHGALQGIITKGDVFKAFVAVSGINTAALAMGFDLIDQPGAIKGITDVIRAHGGRIVSILTAVELAAEGSLRVFIRARNVADEKALQKELAEKSKLLYYIHEKVD